MRKIWIPLIAWQTTANVASSISRVLALAVQRLARVTRAAVLCHMASCLPCSPMDHHHPFPFSKSRRWVQNLHLPMQRNSQHFCTSQKRLRRLETGVADYVERIIKVTLRIQAKWKWDHQISTFSAAAWQSQLLCVEEWGEKHKREKVKRFEMYHWVIRNLVEETFLFLGFRNRLWQYGLENLCSFLYRKRRWNYNTTRVG